MKNFAIVILIIITVSMLFSMAYAAPDTDSNQDTEYTDVDDVDDVDSDDEEDDSGMFSVLDDIKTTIGELFSSIGNMPERFFNFFMIELNEGINNIVSMVIKEAMNGFAWMITDNDKDLLEYPLVKGISDFTLIFAVPMAYLFFLLYMNEQTISFSLTTMQSLASLYLRLFFTIGVMGFSRTIIGAALDLNHQLIRGIANLAGMQTVNIDLNLPNLFLMSDQIKLAGLFFFLIVVLAVICIIFVYVMLIWRWLDLMVDTALAPLYICTLAGGGLTSEIAKNYFKGVCANIFQTTIMMTILALFSGGIVSKINGHPVGGFASIIGSIALTIAFALALILSKGKLNNIFGVGSSGVGGALNTAFSAAKTAALFV